MQNKVQIHDNSTNETGTYKIWYKENGENKCRVLSEATVNSLLNMRQKEMFFIGQSVFIIESDYDFKTKILNP
jgi:hypothetical protein